MNLFCRDSARKLDAFLFRNVPRLFFESFRKVRARLDETEISLARWNVDFSVLSPNRGIYIVLGAFSNRRINLDRLVYRWKIVQVLFVEDVRTNIWITEPKSKNQDTLYCLLGESIAVPRRDDSRNSCSFNGSGSLRIG